MDSAKHFATFMAWVRGSAGARGFGRVCPCPTRATVLLCISHLSFALLLFHNFYTGPAFCSCMLVPFSLYLCCSDMYIIRSVPWTNLMLGIFGTWDWLVEACLRWSSFCVPCLCWFLLFPVVSIFFGNTLLDLEAQIRLAPIPTTSSDVAWFRVQPVAFPP